MNTRRKGARVDWHPEDIKAAVRKTGTTLAELARANGLSESACRKSLYVAAPRADRAIAKQINVPLHELWPSRYDNEGRRVIIHVREQGSYKINLPQRLLARAV